MMRITLLALSLLTACGWIDQRKVQEELKSRRQRWIALGLTDYTFDLSRSCFCPPPHGPVRVVVRNHQVVSVIELQPGTPPQPIPAEFRRSITEIFDYLIRVAEDADQLSVVYDATYHFPREVRADPIKNAIDDEFSMALTGFRAGAQ